MKAKGKYVAARDINIKYSGNKVKSKWSFWAGMGFSLLSLILSLFMPCPSPSQLMVLRFLLAIALACLAASTPGFFHIKRPEFEIGAGLIVFFLVFFTVPFLLGNLACKEIFYLHGEVYYKQQPAEGALIMSPDTESYTISNVQGTFNLKFRPELLKSHFQLHLKYQSLDTLIQVHQIHENQAFKINLRP